MTNIDVAIAKAWDKKAKMEGEALAVKLDRIYELCPNEEARKLLVEIAEWGKNWVGCVPMKNK